jgi:hypothetical protein
MGISAKNASGKGKERSEDNLLAPEPPRRPGAVIK